MALQAEPCLTEGNDQNGQQRHAPILHHQNPQDHGQTMQKGTNM